MPAQIKHIVVLMMENRSFDHMFGFLHIDNPAVAGDKIDALTGNETNPNVDGTLVRVSADAEYAGDYRVDPGHHFPDVNIQLFGVDPPPAGALPTNQGFVKSYAAHQGQGNEDKAGRVMKCFAPERIPVLTGLARQFAICDRWFSSLPGPTLPNRAFVHAAMSNGHVDMNPVAYWGVPTIYEALDKVGVSSKVYSFDGNTLAFMFQKLFAGGNKFLGQYDDFLNDLDGNLPTYCFVEPRFNDWYDEATDQNFVASDQHPDNDVEAGEQLIADVYEAVRASKYWPETLLVIVYDEHGGMFDHVLPPSGVPNPGPVDPTTGFDFTRLGLRVPAVLISAYTKPGTIVHTQLEHTSVATTVRKLLAPAMPPLTARDRSSNAFDEVLNLNAARPDAPQKLARNVNAFRADTNTHGQGSLNEHQLTQLLAAYHVDLLQPADRRVLGRLVQERNVQDLDTEQKAAQYIQLVAGQTAPAVFKG